MNRHADRFWLVVLGVAVAIAVLMTTLVWSRPGNPRSGAVPTVAPAPNRTSAPRIGAKLLNVVKKTWYDASVGRH